MVVKPKRRWPYSLATNEVKNVLLLILKSCFNCRHCVILITVIFTELLVPSLKLVSGSSPEATTSNTSKSLDVFNKNFNFNYTLAVGANNNSNITFEKISRYSFDSLMGVQIEDEPFDPPEWSQLTKQERKILRKQLRKQRNKNNHQRKGLPGRHQALAIVTKEAVKPGHCRIMPMKQRMRMDGCVPKIIVNHFCYGQCNSFFIPKLSRKRLRTAFESCSVCQPSEFAPIIVTLHCPYRNPPYVEQEIMTIKDCTCKAVCNVMNDVL